MPKNDREPKIVKPDMIKPTYDWKRPLAAPGHGAVDFEERVNFRRLHDYRLARARGCDPDRPPHLMKVTATI
jgi:hypothetical protein